MAAVGDAGLCLVLLCGLPAVGKTSLALELRGAAAELGWRLAVLSYDELILEQAFLPRPEEDPGQTHTEWKLHRQAVLKSIEHFLEKPSADPSDFPDVCQNINRGAWRKCVEALQLSPEPASSPAVLLLDDNFYYPSMRYEVHQLARKHSLGFCQLYLHCDLKTCLRRNQCRPRAVPGEVLEEMDKRLQRPNPERNSWETNSLDLDTTHGFSSTHTQKAMDLISSALKNPLSPIEDNTEQKEADRLKCAQSVVHRADQACRRLISEAMKTARDSGVSSSALTALASELNQAKGRLLVGLRAQLLRDAAFLASEDLDVERAVTRAVEVFDRDRRDVLSQTVKDHR